MARSSIALHLLACSVALYVRLGFGLSGSADRLKDNNDFSVVAYLPEWRYEGANWDRITEHVSHLVLFSLEMTANGKITAKDRIPRAPLLEEARAAAEKNNAYLMICFGGNGRSAGFSGMVRRPKKRKKFVKALKQLIDEYGFHGVDYNWEYPGYKMGQGYLSEEEVQNDYEGLESLLQETRAALGDSKQITMAYYPDNRQEQVIKALNFMRYVDLFHMMTYDAGGIHHSTYELAQKGIDQVVKLLPEHTRQFTVGLPFYGRNTKTAEWTTYEDILKDHGPLAPDQDVVILPGGDRCGFNGILTIEAKVSYAISKNLGGAMIWEVGQDCRLEKVVHKDDSNHEQTCKTDNDSLLVAITRTIKRLKWKRTMKEEL